MLNRRNLLKLFGLGAVEPVVNNTPIPIMRDDAVSIIKHISNFQPVKLFIRNNKVFKEERYYHSVSQNKEITYEINYYNDEGQLHRDGDLPAHVTFHGGKTFIEQWFKNGKSTREGDKPTHIVNYEDRKECFWEDSYGYIFKKYSSNTGCTEFYDENGKLKEIINPDGTKKEIIKKDEYKQKHKPHFVTAKDGYGLIYMP